MSKVRDKLLRDIKHTTDRAADFQKGEYTFTHARILEFSYDVTEAFEAEPELLEDTEIKELMAKMINELKPFFMSILDNHGTLQQSVMDARADFNYNAKYFWLWLPEMLMDEKQLKAWKKYIKKAGYEV